MKVYKCDVCNDIRPEKAMIGLLTLTMPESYPKFNSIKGTFGTTNDWDLCPICFERINKAIRDVVNPNWEKEQERQDDIQENTDSLEEKIEAINSLQVTKK